MPLAEPPVGTRGRPFRDRFFSGIVGKSQFPALAEVLENGRRLPDAFCGLTRFDVEGIEEALIGRRGVDAIDSLSK